jgi:NDP-sugar pyrophosphorylase family protein
MKELLNSGSLPELPGLRIEVVAPPDNGHDQFEKFGSANVLEMFSDRINRDFILMTGYFVSDICLKKMIEMHYEKNSILTCLLSDKACNSTPPGPQNQQSCK